MILPSITLRPTRVAFFFLLLSSVFLNLSCATSPSNRNVTGNPKPGEGPEKKPATVKLLSSNVDIQPVGGNREPLAPGLRELQNGDSLTTDQTGEAAIELDTCRIIYIYRDSNIRKDSCSKQSGNYYCTKKGTGAFKDCSSKIITESDSATVALLGTWASHTYIPEMEMAVVLLFEGKAEARPVLDTRERTLGEAKPIPAEHFWFSVPDNRLNELKSLNLGLEPRKAYPFVRLPELLAKLPNMHLDSVAEQAISDNAAPKDILPSFIPKHPPIAGDNNTHEPGTGPGTGGGPGGPGTGGGRGGPGTGTGVSSVVGIPYGLTKIGNHTTKGFSPDNGALLQPSSIQLASASGSFHTVPTTPGSDRFEVLFAPTKSGDDTAVLTFEDKSGRRYQYQLTGTGASSAIKASSDNLTFSGPDPRIDRLGITSTGDFDLEINKVSLLQDPNQRFRIQSNCNAPLKKNQRCEVTIEHTRATANISSGTRDLAVLSIAHDAFPKPMLVLVSAPLLPALDIAETLTFGPVVIAGTCDKILTVKSNSDQPIRLGQAALDRIKSQGFDVAEDTCSNSTLSPAGKKECNLKIKFQPGIAARQDAQLTLPYGSSSGSTSRTVKLSGQGKEAQFTFLTSAAFGSVQVGANEKVEKIKVRRLPQVVTQIERVELSGPAKDDYQIRSQTCTTSTSDLCEVEIAFKPKAEGLRAAELVLVTQAESGVNSTPITGNAISALTKDDSSPAYTRPASLTQVQGPSIAAESLCGREYRVHIDGKAYAPWEVREKSGMCFGGKSVKNGKDPDPRIMELHFEGETKEPLSPSFVLSGDGRDDFSVISKECNEPTKSCLIKIAFAPKATNKRLAIMTVAPNSVTPPVEVELYGRGKSSNPFKRFGRWVVGLFTDEAARSCKR
jgi:hypothetical protein